MAFSPLLQAWSDSGRYVEAGGQSLFVVERGRGPNLVLVHGYPTSGYDFRGLMACLEGRFRCVAFDFPGYGLSSKPVAHGYSLFQQADTLEALLEALSIRSASFLCHDMGTSGLCELLARKDEGRLRCAIEHVTFTNGSMLQWRATITPFQKLLASNETLFQAMEICARMPDAYVAGLRTLMKKPEAVSADDEVVMRELLVHEDGHLRLAALAGYMRERYLHRDRWIGALSRNAGLVSLVWAAGDPIANLELGRELHALLPGAPYVELEGLGHFLIFEDPERVADCVPGGASRS
jgi:pimeloyl-ACP methyl ester carboxylesterase